MRNLSFAASALLGLAVLLTSSVEAKEFRWKLKAGEEFQVKFEQQQRQTVEAMGQKFDVPNNMTATMTWKVDSVDSDGNFVLTQSIDRIQMKMNAPNIGEIDFDSKDEKEPTGLAAMIVGMFKPLIGAKITQTMTPRGEILDTKIPEAVEKAMAGGQAAGQMFGEDQVKELMSKGVPAFPAESIEKGFSWTSNSEAKTPAGNMKMNSKYTYMGEEKVDGVTLDRFDVKTDIEISGVAGALGAEVKVDSQDNNGSIFFDSAKGRFVKSEMKQDMKMSISVAGQDIKQQMKSTVNMTVNPASGN